MFGLKKKKEVKSEKKTASKKTVKKDDKKITKSKKVASKSESASKTPKKVYFVKKVEGEWQVILRDGSKVIKKFATKIEAEEFAKATAKNQNGTVLTHASKGKNKGRFQ
ncbi:MAG: DUF2188 domain-containing protein [Bacilli bacterium]